MAHACASRIHAVCESKRRQARSQAAYCGAGPLPLNAVCGRTPMEEGEREQLGKCFALDITIVSENQLALSSRPQRQRIFPRSETLARSGAIPPLRARVLFISRDSSGAHVGMTGARSEEESEHTFR